MPGSAGRVELRMYVNHIPTRQRQLFVRNEWGKGGGQLTIFSSKAFSFGCLFLFQ